MVAVEPYLTFSEAKAWEITANHPGVGYQYKMTITHEAEMQPDFADIRFSDGTTALKYYIDSYIESTSAVVYIKVSAVNYIYLHYGNASATSESSGADVFDFFDDFLGSSIDASKWTVTNDVSLSGGECVLTSGTTRGILEGKTGFTQPVRVESKARFSTQLFDGSVVCGLRQAGDDNNRLYVSGKNIDTGGIYFATITGGTVTNTGYAQSTNTASHIYSVLWETNSAKMYIDDTLRATNTTNVSAGTQYVTLKEGSTAGQTSYVDWIRVRKYVETEPTIEIYTIPIDIDVILEYNEETIMEQTPGTTQNQPVQIRSSTGELITESLTSVAVYYSLNGGARTEWTPAPTISGYDSYMLRHMVEIPDVLDSRTFISGDKLEISIGSDQGTGHAMIYFKDIISSDLLKTLYVMLTGTVTGLISGSGSPVTFTGADGSTVAFTVDANGNRTLTAITLV